MHLHDNDGVRDLHSMPFHGTIDWERKVGRLKKSRLFHEMITLECGIVGNTAEEGFKLALDGAKN